MDSEREFQELVDRAGKAATNVERAALFEQALAIRPAHSEILTRLSATYALLQKWEDSLDRARRAVRAEPKAKSAWDVMLKALNELGILEDSEKGLALCRENLQWIERYVADHPAASRGWQVKAVSLAAANDFAGSLTAVDEAIKLAPNDAECWFLRGGSLLGLGRNKDAAHSFGRAQQLGHPQAADSLKTALSQLDDKTLKELAGKKKPCFIATAALGSALAPEVVILRTYRDTVLRSSRSGRLLVLGYEFVSPPIARWISARPRARRWTAHTAIRPLAIFAAASMRRRPDSVGLNGSEATGRIHTEIVPRT
jgi:tetratricopeptide (TPR) repeat protein